MLRTSFLVNTVDVFTIFALCTSADGPLSMYQVSYNSLVYFQRYAPDKLSIANIKKGSNSVNAVDRVRVVAFCNSPHGPLSSFVKLPSILLEICFGQKCEGRTDGQMDGWTDGRMDGRTVGRTKRQLYVPPSGNIKRQ